MNLRVKLALPVAGVLAALVFLAPKAPKWGYDYKKASTWKYETLVAEFDFPILKTKAQLDAEKEHGSLVTIPYYRYSSDILSEQVAKLEAMDFGDCSPLKLPLESALVSIYEKGVVSDEDYHRDLQAYSADNSVVYVQRNKRAAMQPIEEIYGQSRARTALRTQVKLSDVSHGFNVDSVLRACGAYDLIVPNLRYDAQMTEIIVAESGQRISPTLGYVKTGQLIVSEGELITAEIAQMLDSYKAEFETNVGYGGKSRFFLWAGNAILVAIILAILIFTLIFTNRAAFLAYNKYLFIIFVFTVFGVLTMILPEVNKYYILLIPYPLGALYLYPFFRNREVLPLYVVFLLPVLFFVDGGLMFFLMFLSGGIACVYSFRFFEKGARQFVPAMLSFLAGGAVFSAFLLLGNANMIIIRVALFFFIGSVLIVAGYPLVYLLERMFRLVSKARLEELGDTSNDMLRALEQRAPGTFQHSLQVMNLATSAARAIGADETLVRVGALYHDIGKSSNPQCFVENESIVSNESGGKYHADLTPIQSAQDIIRHVPDGTEIARENKLPEAVVDFILTHHGTSTMTFFYDKYLKQGGDPEMKASFQYHGRRPSTREQVIVLFADSIEAASRTLGDYSTESISRLVNGIIDSKISDGQLDEAAFTLKDLKTVREGFVQYLCQIYHERIAYPKRKNNH